VRALSDQPFRLHMACRDRGTSAAKVSVPDFFVSMSRIGSGLRTYNDKDAVDAVMESGASFLTSHRLYSVSVSRCSSMTSAGGHAFIRFRVVFPAGLLENTNIHWLMSIF
jgi:hypothetical protein